MLFISDAWSKILMQELEKQMQINVSDETAHGTQNVSIKIGGLLMQVNWITELNALSCGLIQWFPNVVSQLAMNATVCMIPKAHLSFPIRPTGFELFLDRPQNVPCLLSKYTVLPDTTLTKYSHVLEVWGCTQLKIHLLGRHLSNWA